MEYAVLGSGKRLRPLLCWHACKAVGGQGEDALPACVALELVHCFSLVHDDLPALDDDDLRRGKPTLHVHAGQAMAILAGDALLNAAYGVLTRAETLCPVVVSLLCDALARACEAMIAGQVLDTLGCEREPALAQADAITKLETIHRGKTGAMLIASVRMGAMCARDFDPDDGGWHDKLEALSEYGNAVGLAFQIVDDVLDVTSSAAQLGKRTGKDAQAGKLTYPGVLGVDASRQRVEELHTQAIRALQPLGSSAQPLIAIAEYLTRRTR